MFPLGIYPVANPDAVCRMVENEMVIVLPTQGQIKVLNEVASQVWMLSDGSNTLQRIIDEICTNYLIDNEQARNDIEEFIQTLIDKSMMTLVAAPLTPCS